MSGTAQKIQPYYVCVCFIFGLETTYVEIVRIKYPCRGLSCAFPSRTVSDEYSLSEDVRHYLLK